MCLRLGGKGPSNLDLLFCVCPPLSTDVKDAQDLSFDALIKTELILRYYFSSAVLGVSQLRKIAEKRNLASVDLGEKCAAYRRKILSVGEKSENV